MSVSGPMESERERLLARIQEHLHRLEEEGAEARTRREWLVQQFLDHYRPLRRFVRREIGRYVPSV